MAIDINFFSVLFCMLSHEVPLTLTDDWMNHAGRHRHVVSDLNLTFVLIVLETVFTKTNFCAFVDMFGVCVLATTSNV